MLQIHLELHNMVKYFLKTDRRRRKSFRYYNLDNNIKGKMHRDIQRVSVLLLKSIGGNFSFKYSVVFRVVFKIHVQVYHITNIELLHEPKQKYTK